jgi:signal transduction histidine kinase
MEAFTRNVDNTLNVLNGFERLSNHLKSAEIYSPIYQNEPNVLYNLYAKELDSIPSELARLKQDVTYNPILLGRVKIIEKQINVQMKTLAEKNIVQIIESRQTFRLDALARIHQEIKDISAHKVDSLNISRIQLQNFTGKNKQYSNIFFVLALSITITAFIYNLLLVRKRKWLEGFLESILNTSHNGIIHYAAVRNRGAITDYRVEFANAAVEHLLGVKASVLIGKKVNELNSFETSPAITSAFMKVVESGEAVEFEWHYEQNGKNEWFNIMLAKMQDGLTATMQKISEVKQSQDELTENIKQLEISNSELEQYAYVASHDLQEPLRKIRTHASYLAALQTNNLDEKGRSHLIRITQAAERMTNLIKDVLNFSGLRREMVFVPTDLNNITDNVIEDLELTIKQKQATIDIVNLPEIHAIPLQINQLFDNLLSNALKFSHPDRRALLTITSSILCAEEVASNPKLNPKLTYCCIGIRDNGIGFNQAFSTQVFGLFKRLHDQQVYPGSGIGLAICSKVVANHNGDIYVHSEEQVGTSFYVILPLTQQ